MANSNQFNLKTTQMGLQLMTMILMFGLILAEPLENVDNVCMTTKTIKIFQQISEPKSTEIKYDSWCGLLPCTKSRLETRMDSRMEPKYVEIQVSACCPGYAETPNRQCAPICLESCNNGKCIKPGLCQCHPEPTETSPGYVGSFCNRFTCLSSTRWGSKCENECSCPNPNSYCSANSGKCLCRNGWRGANCTEQCEPSMNCVDVDLPPIIEPEVNLISDNSNVARSQRLQLVDPAAVNLVENSSASRSVTSLVAAHMGLNLLLTLLTFSLFFAAFWYRRRLNKLREELYYTAPYSTTTRSAGSNSIYSEPSFGRGGTQSGRPGTTEQSNFLTKNLDFHTATRDILNKSSILDASTRANYVLDPKVESHLVRSQLQSQQNLYSEQTLYSSPQENIYSDLESVISDKSVSSTAPSHPPTQMPSIIESSAEEHVYQVPRTCAAPPLPKANSPK